MKELPADQIPAPQPHPDWLAALLFGCGVLFAATYWTLGTLIVIALSLVTHLWSTSPENRRRFGQKVLARLIDGLVRGLIFLRIIHLDDSGLRNPQSFPPRAIFASNHPALWDALLILRHLRRLSCITKAELHDHPLARNPIQFAGFLPNAPRLAMIKAALARLDSDGQLLLFPEGTRTKHKNGAVNPFRPGFAILAVKGSAPSSRF